MKKVRNLYVSSNGDRWYLVYDPPAAVFIRQEANLASGGTVSSHFSLGPSFMICRGPDHGAARDAWP
jgi:hypothetical protein